MASSFECVNCGARLTGRERQCPLCGTSVHIGRTQRLCPYCGMPVARRAQTCLMCHRPLDDVVVPGALRSISWTWVVAVALLAMLGGLSWNWWRAAPDSGTGREKQTQHGVPPSAVATPTSYHLATPTSIPPTFTPRIELTPPSPSPTPTPLIHVVKSGETLLLIASYYDVELQDLMQANGLDEAAARRLRVGQELVIPGAAGPSAEVTRGKETRVVPVRRVVHTVQPGDTLISIALQYGADLDAIIAANPDINPDLIYVSQQIVVPLLPPTSTPTSTPTPTPTSTPGPPFQAPVLLYPTEGQIFEGADAFVTLSWVAVEELNREQAYLVEIEVPGQPTVIQHVTQSTSWRLSPELWPVGTERNCFWRVTIVERSSDGEAIPAAWRRLSPPSQVRHFEWR